MLNEGKMIGARYEIVSHIGAGGMADVYKARDTRLNRFVAIKVLKEEFSSDKNFVVKFRAEAQSAAGLSHPNIVNVYDVGDEGGLYYIVMELVEGITLKKFIEKKGKLTVREALGITIQIAQGMEAAHANHIIHRDIKPQNIIISREGKVKVTDFGIAKAATSNTISAGQALGSVHYISPEQARGGYSDEKSDIYSLGVTMYEMLSGRMPFSGDNTVSVALLHIQEEATPLRELDPSIPVSVEKIVQKCMQKKPERRYLTATELIRDLKQAVNDPNGDFVHINNAEVPDSPTIKISDEDLSKIRKAKLREDSDITPDRNRQRFTEERNTHDDHEDDDEDVDPKMEKFVMIGGIAAIVILVIVIIFILFKVMHLLDGADIPNMSSNVAVVSSETGSTPTASLPASTSAVEEEGPVVIPDIKGMSLTDAISSLKESKITNYRFDYKDNDEIAKDTVIETDPAIGTQIDGSETVVIIVSKGEGSIPVPDVSGQTEDSARTTLEALGFKVSANEDNSDDVPAGQVISTDPAGGAEAKEGDTVTILISRGPEQQTMQDVTGMTEKKALSALAALGLTGSVSTEYSDDVAKGVVISQSIEAGTKVDPGTAVKLVVSKGQKEIVYKYVGSTSIDYCPFGEGESGEIRIDMDQDGNTTTIYSGTVSAGDFPLNISGIEGSSESQGMAYMYVNGELYNDQVWTVGFQKEEVTE